MFPRRSRHEKRILSRGLSLVEVVVSVAIVVPILVLVLSVFFKNVRGVVETWEETTATAAGQRLMDNIRRMKWDEQTPNGGGRILTSLASLGLDAGESTPDQFDDIDDWNGFTAPDPLPEYARYGRSVQVQFVAVVSAEIVESGTNTDIKRVFVTITKPSGKSVVFSSLFTNSLP